MLNHINCKIYLTTKRRHYLVRVGEPLFDGNVRLLHRGEHLEGWSITTKTIILRSGCGPGGARNWLGSIGHWLGSDRNRTPLLGLVLGDYGTQLLELGEDCGLRSFHVCHDLGRLGRGHFARLTAFLVGGRSVGIL